MLASNLNILIEVNFTEISVKSNDKTDNEIVNRVKNI